MIASLESALQIRGKEMESLQQDKAELQVCFSWQFACTEICCAFILLFVFQQELQLRMADSEKKVEAELQQSEALKREHEEIKVFCFNGFYFNAINDNRMQCLIELYLILVVKMLISDQHLKIETFHFSCLYVGMMLQCLSFSL